MVLDKNLLPKVGPSQLFEGERMKGRGAQFLRVSGPPLAVGCAVTPEQRQATGTREDQGRGGGVSSGRGFPRLQTAVLTGDPLG